MNSNDPTLASRADTAADLAASLRHIATLLDADGSVPLGDAWPSLHIQPHGTEPERIAAIDALLRLLRGKPGAAQAMSGGVYHHSGDVTVGCVEIGVYTGITSPAERALRAEIETLQTQLATTAAASYAR
ncbi:hypothetical protein [Catelliglobosispora koreensis]|uniref:hypothetical protein n=1 Tax=Catelliglobosispora koreensis TaxID=129052 RepID=UPI0003640E25|nr:hypothetical protein [Catelliglobosispora koreensis]